MAEKSDGTGRTTATDTDTITPSEKSVRKSDNVRSSIKRMQPINIDAIDGASQYSCLKLYRGITKEQKLNFAATKFKVDDDDCNKATCRYCDNTKTYSWNRKNANNAIIHYEKKHAKQWYDDVSRLVSKEVEKRAKKGSQQSIVNFGSASKLPQLKYNASKRLADLYWVNCVAKNDLPFELGKKPELRQWINAVMAVPTNVQSQYNPATPDTIRKYLPIIEKAIRRNAILKWREALKFYSVPFAALENDIWKDATGVNYLGSIIHWTVPNKSSTSDKIRISVFLGLKEIVGSHTGDNLAMWQREILESWGFLEPIKNTVFRVEKDGEILDMKSIIHSATPDNASNVQKAMRTCSNVVLGCQAHRVALVLKQAIGGSLVTATDKMREVFDEHKDGLHTASLKKQLSILETLLDVNLQEAMYDVNEPVYDSKPVSDMLNFCAKRSAFMNKSTKGADKMISAQEVLKYDKFTRAVVNGGVRWSGVYLMVKRDDLNCPAIQYILDDPKELTDEFGLWTGAAGRSRREKFKPTRQIREMRREFIASTRPLMQCQINIQSADDSLADSMEHILDCKLLLGDDITIEVAKTSGPNPDFEMTCEDDLTSEIRAYRVRLRENMAHYFPSKPGMETLVNYFLHPLHKDLESLNFTQENKIATLAEVKREVTKRCLSIYEANLSLERHIAEQDTSSAESGFSTESCTPVQKSSSEKRTANHFQDSAKRVGQMLSSTEEVIDVDKMSPVSKRRRLLLEKRQKAIVDKDGTPHTESSSAAFKIKIRREISAWENLPCVPPQDVFVKLGRGLAIKTVKKQIHPSIQAVEYWHSMKGQFPILYMVALISFSVLPTSCRSESIFSLSGNVQDSKRKASFKGSTFESISFVKGNATLLPPMTEILEQFEAEEGDN